MIRGKRGKVRVGRVPFELDAVVGRGGEERGLEEEFVTDAGQRGGVFKGVSRRRGQLITIGRKGEYLIRSG